MGIGPSHTATTTHSIPLVQLRVRGTLCTPALPRIEHAIDEVMAVSPALLVLDLSDCPLIDAAGIALLLDLHRRMRRGGGRLTVQASTSEVRRVLRIARVDQVLDLQPDESHGEAAPWSSSASRPTPPRSRRRAAVPMERAAVPMEKVASEGGLL